MEKFLNYLLLEDTIHSLSLWDEHHHHHPLAMQLNFMFNHPKRNSIPAKCILDQCHQHHHTYQVSIQNSPLLQNSQIWIKNSKVQGGGGVVDWSLSKICHFANYSRALSQLLCPAHNLSVCTSHRRWHINFVEINSHHIVHFSFRSEKDHQSLTAAASYRHPSKRLGEVKPIELEWRSCHTSTLPHLYTSTLPHLHTSTLPHLHTSTIPQFHTFTFPWRSCPTSIGTSKRRWKDR